VGKLTFPDQQQDLQNAAEFSLASECDRGVKVPRLPVEADWGGSLPGGVQVGWGVSEVQAAFVTSPEGSRRTVMGVRYDSPILTSTISH
jgi:hypothetical protein